MKGQGDLMRRLQATALRLPPLPPPPPSFSSGLLPRPSLLLPPHFPFSPEIVTWSPTTTDEMKAHKVQNPPINVGLLNDIELIFLVRFLLSYDSAVAS